MEISSPPIKLAFILDSIDFTTRAKHNLTTSHSLAPAKARSDDISHMCNPSDRALIYAGLEKFAVGEDG